MSEYVVAFASLFENTIDMHVVRADSEIDAIIAYAEQFTDWDISQFDYQNLEELKEEFFDGDCLVNVIQL